MGAIEYACQEAALHQGGVPATLAAGCTIRGRATHGTLTGEEGQVPQCQKPLPPRSLHVDITALLPRSHEQPHNQLDISSARVWEFLLLEATLFLSHSLDGGM